jgi:hypothetical protein
LPGRSTIGAIVNGAKPAARAKKPKFPAMEEELMRALELDDDGVVIRLDDFELEVEANRILQ